MVIFVRDIPVNILTKSDNRDFTRTTFTNSSEFRPSGKHDKLFFKNTGSKYIIAFLKLLQGKSIEGLSEVTFLVDDIKAFKKQLKNEFHFIKAAGGIVENSQQEILLIKRLGKWDLPKGKADKGENAKTTAEREVEEECGVKIKISKKVSSSWHTYTQKGQTVIKRTKWFRMDLISDRRMKPQTEEGIEEIKWISIDNLDIYMENTYSSIQFILEKYIAEKLGGDRS